MSLLEALNLQPRLGIREVEVPADALVEVALATDLSVYDAAYLHLALEAGLGLVTLDRRLARAWRRARGSGGG